MNPQDYDIPFVYSEELRRIYEQGLINLRPWHLLDPKTAKSTLEGLRTRYSVNYVPFAQRQDDDEIACFVPELPERVIIVEDFVVDGTERMKEFDTFWDWFRAAVEDMILFE